MQIEPLTRAHDYKSFRCGNAALDEYLHRYALQDQRRRLSSCYLLTDGGSVLGYYTLSAASLLPASLPDGNRRALPRHRPIPAILLGRLAVSLNSQGRGQGAILLANAIERCTSLANQLGAFALVVDAKPEAVAFYLHFGFHPLRDDPGRLFLVLAGRT